MNSFDYSKFPKHSVECWISVLTVIAELSRLYVSFFGMQPSWLLELRRFLENIAKFQHLGKLDGFINLLYNSDGKKSNR